VSRAAPAPRAEKVEEIDGHDALTPEDCAWVQGLIDEVTEDRIKEDERPRGAPEGEMPAGTGSKKGAAAAAAAGALASGRSPSRS